MTTVRSGLEMYVTHSIFDLAARGGRPPFGLPSGTPTPGMLDDTLGVCSYDETTLLTDHWGIL